MRKLLAVISASVFGVLFVTPLTAQDHLLITEFVVTPTAGEFIEIFNPTPDSVDLTNYYLSDEIFNNNNNYINIVKGGFSAFSSDFMVKFPDGTKIGPKQFMTVAFSGSGFKTTYGVASNFEIKGDDTDTPDMTKISVGGSAGLSNDGEVIILFHWDGLSDLVEDVDIVVWGDKVEAVDKTGVKIDGPDANTDSTAYLPDTPKADQHVVNAENDADPNPHDDGMSAQRKLDVEDVENWPGGNGITGHNETNENTSWKGGIWSLNAPATPGARALGDSLNIADIQFVRADSISAMAKEDSKFTGDTLTVSGIVMHGTRKIFLGHGGARLSRTNGEAPGADFS